MLRKGYRLVVAQAMNSSVYAHLSGCCAVPGFSSDSFPLFRNASGAPLTPRNPAIPNQVSDAYSHVFGCTIEGTTVICARVSCLEGPCGKSSERCCEYWQTAIVCLTCHHRVCVVVF